MLKQPELVKESCQHWQSIWDEADAEKRNEMVNYATLTGSRADNEDGRGNAPQDEYDTGFRILKDATENEVLKTEVGEYLLEHYPPDVIEFHKLSLIDRIDFCKTIDGVCEATQRPTNIQDILKAFGLYPEDDD